MILQNELKSALVGFLNSGDESAIQSIIAAHPEIVTSSYGDYPDTHRVVDIRIGNKRYRVCRQISTGEKLTLSLIDEVMDDPGVPLWLDGEKLRAWAKSEEESPSDESIDWENYK
jgi:hypothetical protein